MTRPLFLTAAVLLLLGALSAARPLAISGYVNTGHILLTYDSADEARWPAVSALRYFRRATEQRPSPENRFRLFRAAYLSSVDAPVSPDGLSVEPLLDMAESSLIRQNWANAEFWARSALETQESAEGNCFLAKAVESAGGEMERTIQLYKAALARGDFREPAMEAQCALWLAAAHFRSNEWRNGDVWLSSFLEAARRADETSLRRPEIAEIVELHLAAKRPDTVQRLVDYGAANNPLDAWQYAAFFDRYFAQSYYPEALTVCHAAPKPLQHQPPLLGRCGRAYYEQGEWEKSIQAFTELDALGEANAWHYYWIAVSHSQLGQPDEAMRYGQQALDSAETDLSVLLRVGALYERMGKPSNALRVYSAGLMTAPDHSGLLEAADRVRDD